MRGGIPDLGSAWSDLKPRMALSYSFELDIFQKEAVLHLEAGHSVSNCVHCADLSLGRQRPRECMPAVGADWTGSDGRKQHIVGRRVSQTLAVLHSACRNGTCVHCVARLDPGTTPCSLHFCGKGVTAADVMLQPGIALLCFST